MKALFEYCEYLVSLFNSGININNPYSPNKRALDSVYEDKLFGFLPSALKVKKCHGCFETTQKYL